MDLSYDPVKPISSQQFSEALLLSLRQLPVDGRRVLVVIPDGTRTLPMQEIFQLLCKALAKRTDKLTFLVALGMHPAMNKEQLSQHLGESWQHIHGIQVLQHKWEISDTLVQIGTLSREDLRRISQGIIDQEVPVRINRQVLQHDLVVLVGPVLPHELIGFSGGNKYFFPGISGPEMIDQSHWLGALVVNPDLNGHKHTPVREMVDTAAALIPTPSIGLSLVMEGHELVGVFLGPVLEAWSKAADLSARVNIREVAKPFQTVLACVPSIYNDLWLASKCVVKLQSIVADGGTLILLAPHIRQAAAGHGDWHHRIGYHLVDYVLQNMERFRDVPKAILGDLTLLKGTGTVCNGMEIPRIDVVLATGIPAEQCREMNLAYRDPSSIRPEKFEGREPEGILVIRDAGEMLWRLRGSCSRTKTDYMVRRKELLRTVETHSAKR